MSDSVRTPYRSCILGSMAIMLCSCAASPPPEPQPQAEADPSVERFSLDLGQTRGISGLAIASDGTPWVIAERHRQLQAIDLGARKTRGEPVAMDGPQRHIDTESLAIAGPGVFYAGTETQKSGRRYDEIVRLELRGNTATVTDRIRLDYDRWQHRAPRNRGIEGLCHVDGVLVMVIESPIKKGYSRHSPLARYDLRTKVWETTTVHLSTSKGKLSSVACKQEPDGNLSLLAIERHFGVGNILRFTLPMRGALEPVVPEVLYDMPKLLNDAPNMEGIAWLPDGRILITVDNDSGGITGPNEAIIVTP